MKTVRVGGNDAELMRQLKRIEHQQKLANSQLFELEIGRAHV